MKHLFIVNPAAGSRDRTEEYRQEIERVCGEKNLDYRIEISQAPGECRKFAADAAATGEDYRIYACGGDGTLNEVVSGVVGCPNVAVTHFAGGSGNDFVRIFSDPSAFRDLDRLTDSEETLCDVIRCNDSYALNVCSVGFDARIGTDIARYKRLPHMGGFRAYALSAVVNVIRGIAEHYVIEVNGRKIDDKKAMVCICNGQYYGGGFHPVPTSDPRDHQFDVLIVEKVSRLRVAMVIGKYKDGRYSEFPQYIHHLQTDKITIHCDKPTGINLDGELLIAEDVNVSLIPDGIRFFYPRGLQIVT